jgi:outer membrane protein
MKLIKSLLTAVFALTLIGPLTSHAASDIGVVDEVKIFSEYEESKQAQQKITELRNQIQTLLVDLNSELEKVNKNKALTEAQKQQKQQEAEKKLVAEKEKAEDIANGLKEKLEAVVIKAISDEAKVQGLSIVLTKDTALYGGKDITNEVIKRLNK